MGGATRRYAALAVAGLLGALSLSGCIPWGNTAKVGDLASADVQDALDSASSALDDATSALDEGLGSAADGVSDALDGLQTTLGDLSDVPALLEEAFGADGLASKATRVEVTDARTGEVLATYDAEQKAELATLFGQFAYGAWSVVPSHPDNATAEYTIRCYQTETQKLGQSADELQEQEVVAITTYRDSNIIHLAVAGSAIELDFEVSEADLSALRGLAA